MKKLLIELESNLKEKKHYFLDDKIIIEVESRSKTANCPYCNQKSNRVHSTYRRTIADLPIQGKEVYLDIKCRKFVCLNETCLYNTFCERFTFMAKSAVKTNRLIDYIKSTSETVSSITATNQLNRNGVKIKKSSICSYIKKK